MSSEVETCVAAVASDGGVRPGGTGTGPPSDVNNDTTDGDSIMLLEPRPFRPFKTSEEYLYAMKEDLAEWLNNLYNLDINVDNFFERLETGEVLCAVSLSGWVCTCLQMCLNKWTMCYVLCIITIVIKV